ncbi:hypothetical protein ACERII_06580 [Evansella sp. AB-rgal1]|uniref:hypothetical protein n=1 Tax=Evansella sp. AB-rgal1 TaxID=3242696 RepID=UPI00359E6023
MTKHNPGDERTLETISRIHRNLAIITAILLLTGQISIMGVFVTPRGFRVTMAGPITGLSRIESKTGNIFVNVGISVINILIAKMLLMEQFSITGSALTPQGFTINAGGPILGVPRVKAKIPKIDGLFNDLDNIHQLTCTFLGVDPKVTRKKKTR